MAAQESRLAIVIDSAAAEARIKALKERLRELGGAADQYLHHRSGDLERLHTKPPFFQFPHHHL